MIRIGPFLSKSDYCKLHGFGSAFGVVRLAGPWHHTVGRGGGAPNAPRVLCMWRIWRGWVTLTCKLFISWCPQYSWITTGAPVSKDILSASHISGWVNSWIVNAGFSVKGNFSTDRNFETLFIIPADFFLNNIFQKSCVSHPLVLNFITMNRWHGRHYGEGVWGCYNPGNFQSVVRGETATLFSNYLTLSEFFFISGCRRGLRLRCK